MCFSQYLNACSSLSAWFAGSFPKAHRLQGERPPRLLPYQQHHRVHAPVSPPLLFSIEAWCKSRDQRTVFVSPGSRSFSTGNRSSFCSSRDSRTPELPNSSRVRIALTIFATAKASAATSPAVTPPPLSGRFFGVYQPVLCQVRSHSSPGDL